MGSTRNMFNRKEGYEQIENNSTTAFSRITCIIGGYLLLRHFVPINPFFAAYFSSPPFNITVEQLNTEIYPVQTFASSAFLLAALLFTDYVRYKPVIIFDGIFALLSMLLLLGIPNISTLYLSQIFGGTTAMSNLASTTYLYAKIDDVKQYQRITGLMRTFMLLGFFISGAFSQFIVSSRWLAESSLVYFSVAGHALCCLCTFFIPSVKNSIYFYSGQEFLHAVDQDSPTIVPQKLSVVIERIAYDFKSSYTNTYVLKWSLWWSFGYAVNLFITVYSQVLWQEMATENTSNIVSMNGAVYCIYYLSGSLSAYCISFVKCDWKGYADLIRSVSSFIAAILIQCMFWSSSLSLVYITYVIYGCIFQIAFVIAESEVAKELDKDCFALIFGFNTFIALVINSILTSLFIQGLVISMSIRWQFLTYALSSALVGFIFLVRFVWIR